MPVVAYRCRHSFMFATGLKDRFDVPIYFNAIACDLAEEVITGLEEPSARRLSPISAGQPR